MSLQFPTSLHLHTIKLVTSLSNISLFIFQNSFTSITALSIFHLRLSLSIKASDLQPLLKDSKLAGYLLASPLSTKWHDFIVSVKRVRNEGRQKVWLAWGEGKKHFVCNFVPVWYPLTGRNPVYVAVWCHLRL